MTAQRAASPYARRPGPSDAALRGRRGVPTLVPIRATVLADLQDELAAEKGEGRDFAERVRLGSGRIIAAASAGSRMAVVNEAGKLSYLASRRLRQTEGPA